MAMPICSFAAAARRSAAATSGRRSSISEGTPTGKVGSERVSGAGASEKLEATRINRVRAHVNLQALTAVGDDEEVRLAERAHAEHPSRRADDRLQGLEFGTVLRAVRIHDRRHVVRAIELVRVGRHAQRDELGQLGFTLRRLFLLVRHRSGGRFLHAVQNPVDEPDRLVGTELAREFERLVHHDRRRRLVLVT